MRKEFGENLEIYANKANHGMPYQKKYIIDAKWWRKWCDYTSFEMSTIKRAASPDTFNTKGGSNSLENTLVV
jgi:hypothetical protein